MALSAEFLEDPWGRANSCRFLVRVCEGVFVVAEIVVKGCRGWRAAASGEGESAAAMTA